MKRLICFLVVACGISSAQRCDSIQASMSGGWKPVASAPRDGREVEMLETYGVAPWYGLFKWSSKMPASVEYQCTGKDGSSYGPADAFSQCGKGYKLEKFELPESKTAPRWMNVEDPHHGVTEDECLFWRPYKSTGQYVDPTGGAQKSIAYWCSAMHRQYDAKADRCK